MTARARLVISTAAACVAASSAFGALFHGWAWLLPVLLMIVVVIAASEAVRSSPLPTAVGPLVATAAALLFGTAYFAGSTAIWHIFPGRSARHHLATLLHDGAGVVHHYAAPVPDRPGVVLLVVIGIAAVTLVADLCALTLDRAAFAVLPLLAVYVVASLLTHHGVGWRVFLLTAGGLLLLLASDTAEARRRWGRRFAGADGGVSGVRAAGRGVAVAALGLAVAMPAVLPGLHNLHGHGSGDGPGPGDGHNITTVNPLVSLSTELRHASSEQVLSYRTPSKTPSYLRLTSLDRFDGTQFSAVELHSTTSRLVAPGVDLAAPPARNDVSAKITVNTLAERWAPMPQVPVEASLPNDWQFDPTTGSVWSTSTTTRFMTYTVESNPDEPSAAELDQIGFDAYTPPKPGSVQALDVAIPAKTPPRVAALAHNLRKSTPYETALAIQDHFLTGGFSYDLDVPPTDSVNALDDFLFKRRIGYCQQYASAMALLARLDGIPARVAVGFTPGVRDNFGNWNVTGGDAHSWPELFFPGVGWLPFEPTPRGDGQAQLPSYAVSRGQKTSTTNPIVKNHHSKPSSQPKPPSGLRKPHPAKNPAAAHRHGGSGGAGGLYGLAAVLVVALALLLPAVARFAGRQRHAHPHGPAAAAHAAWCEVHDSVVDLGFEWPVYRSPQQTVRLLLRTIPALGRVHEPLRRIAVAEQQARYAPAITADVGPALRADVAAVRSALFARAGRGQRIRAAVLPRSSLRAFGERVRAGVPLPGTTGRVRQATRRRSASTTTSATRPRPAGPPRRRT